MKTSSILPPWLYFIVGILAVLVLPHYMLWKAVLFGVIMLLLFDG